ncbi:sensor histidine kinase [Paenibacillus thermotolerans]|uniref:sensor histidine kinase n=1 Tax=Paenibacillus thermotolerans TaxID=3027807 RepID=UPI0023676B3D|nr:MULTISPECIES: sensor histidine kinase [unclassified Paenibacillus]
MDDLFKKTSMHSLIAAAFNLLLIALFAWLLHDNTVACLIVLPVLAALFCYVSMRICFYLSLKKGKASEQNFRHMITKSVIQAQEEERRRVSRDLHDSVGQALYSVLIGLKIVNQLKMEESVKDHLLEVERLTSKAMDEVKSLAVELRPPTLDDLGLIPALKTYFERYEYLFGIRVKLTVQGRPRRYGPHLETAIYRICQEALTNAAKYADTAEVEVVVEDEGDVLTIVIKDYGRGFEPAESERNNGLGLYSMQERAALMNGKAEIHSVPGAGTTVTVVVPVK